MKRWLLLVLGMVLLAGCVRPETATPAGSLAEQAGVGEDLPTRGLATVESIRVQLTEGQPAEVRVTARGRLEESCVSIDNIAQSLSGGRFSLRVETIRRPAEGCRPETTMFDESVLLNVVGLPAGLYAVEVNGLKGSFTLQRDNIVDETNALVRGRVWDDVCPETGAAADDPRPGEGCVIGPEGTYVANGRQDAGEASLSGVAVSLGGGRCPSTGLAATLTDDEGIYLFAGLPAGLYCLSIDPLQGQNPAILTTGLWTAPEAAATAGQESNAAQITFALQPGENRLNLDFGWDRAASRGPVPTAEGTRRTERDRNCTDQARFVSDVTLSDNAIVSAGQPFTKIWRLRNEGTCTWGLGYSLVFVEGEPMDAPEFVPLEDDVRPGQTADLAVTLIAPEEGGIYPSFWMIRNPDGELFGIGPEADTAFWLQVVVPEG